MVVSKNDDKYLVEQRRAIQKIELLPSIPITLQKIIETSSDPNSSAEDMQNTIEKDQAISAAILKLANSAYYGYARQVNDIKQAIIVIGFNTAVSVAISISVLKTLSEKFQCKEFNLVDFWRHTIATGETARIIAREIEFPLQSQAYIFGLLHDIGKVVLFFLHGSDFDDAVFESRTLKNPLHSVESKIFGFDHQTAGGWLADRWKLPEAIVSGIKYHHDIESCPKDFISEALITHAANYIVKAAEFGNSGDNSIPDLHTKVLTDLKLNMKTIKHITSALELKRKEIDAFLEMIL